MDSDIEKSKILLMMEIIGYLSNAIVIKTVIKKPTGNITLLSFDTGEVMAEKTSPFDTFVQVIDGVAEIQINNTANSLKVGESIIIPAHSKNVIKANQRFKMISTVIKSGYEYLTLY